MSRSISVESRARRASVYRIAAGGIVVDRAEVALAVDEHVAQREVLRHPCQRVVDRRVAVRVVLAHHLADDEGGLSVGPVRLQAKVVHRVEHTAVHRLQAVADVGQGAADDHAHRVVEIRRAHLVGQLALLDPAAGKRVGALHLPHLPIHNAQVTHRGT